MRFKATLLEAGPLVDVLQALVRVGSHCMVCVDEESMHLHVTDRFSAGEKAFVDVPFQGIFHEFTVERKGDRKEIPFKASLSHLLRAVKAVNIAEHVRMELRRDDSITGAYLNFSADSDTARVQQDVPVELVQFDEWEEYGEPDIGGSPDIQIDLPALSSLKNVVARMSKIGVPYVDVEAGKDGSVVLQGASELAVVKTFYRGLELLDLPDVEEEEEEEEEEEKEEKDRFSVTVDLQMFARVLQCSLLQKRSLRIAACIKENVTLVVFVQLHADISLTYYIPVRAEAAVAAGGSDQ